LFVFGLKIGQGPGIQDWFVEYTVANYGKIPAVIEDARAGFEFSDQGTPGVPKDLPEDHSLMLASMLAAGEQRILRESFGSVIFEISIDGSQTREVPNLQIRPSNMAFFRVVISYHGPLGGNTRRAGAGYTIRPSTCWHVMRRSTMRGSGM
jgi:hypothetical protein